MTLRLFVLLLCAVCSATAQDGFRYYVSDETRTEKLYYEHAHDFTISNLADPEPRLVFYTKYHIDGCAQASFTYTEERCEQDLPRQRFNKLLAAIREIPPKKLRPKESRKDEPEWSSGWLELDGVTHTINARLNQPERAKLHGLILAFIDAVAPKATRKTVSRTIEGDVVPARPVSFETLLRTPQQFDGKRLRLAGYYHHEFEYSNFGPTMEAGSKHSVWLHGDSTFANPANVNRPNDTFLTIEGTFDARSHGHGGWPGELTRVTRITKTKP